MATAEKELLDLCVQGVLKMGLTDTEAKAKKIVRKALLSSAVYSTVMETAKKCCKFGDWWVNNE